MDSMSLAGSDSCSGEEMCNGADEEGTDHDFRLASDDDISLAGTDASASLPLDVDLTVPQLASSSRSGSGLALCSDAGCRVQNV